MTEAAAWRVVARAILLVFSVILLAAVIRELKAVILQLLLAVLFAAALNPAVDAVTGFMERRAWKVRPGRGITAVLTFVVVLCALVGTISAVLATVIPDLRTLAANLPRYAQRAQIAFNDFVAQHPELGGPLAPSGGGQPPLQVQDLLSGIASLATRAPMLVGVLTAAFGEVLYLIFALILALYLTIDGERIRRYLVTFFPWDRQDQALKVTERVGGRLGAWARGEALLGTIIGTMTWISALVLGLPYAGALAFMAAIGELIPGIGPIIAAIPFIIVGFLVSPTHGVIAIIVAIGIQQLENHLIVPRVMGHAVELHPVVVMVAILAGSELLGVMGALIAVPVAASLAVVIEEIQRERLARHNGEHELAAAVDDEPLSASAEPPLEPVDRVTSGGA